MFRSSKNRVVNIALTNPENSEEVVGNINMKDVDGYDILPYAEAVKSGMGELDNPDNEYICVYHLNGDKDFFSADNADIICE